jgi:hypothetical protein
MTTMTTARPSPAMLGRRGGVIADDGDVRSALAEAGAATALADATVAQIDADNTRDGIGPDPAAALDEAREFIAKFVSATPAQLDALTLWAAATHGLQVFPTFPRLLIVGEMNSGKTEAMLRTTGLASNPWDADATPDALRSRLSCPPDMKPTLVLDEISDTFGKSGRGGATNPLGKVLRKGYKQGATQSFSVNRVAEAADIYTAAAMTGRGIAVPDDVRTRCIIVKMVPGEPRCEYTVREYDQHTKLLRASLACWVRGHLGELEEFRAKGIHPKLTGRRREIWEPLFAAAALARGSWPRRALSAFMDLAIDQADQPVLTPKQTAVRDIQRAAWAIGGEQIPGRQIIAEIRTYRNPLYEGMGDRALAMFLAEAMYPVQPEQLTRDANDGKQPRGYWLRDIERIAAARLPKEPEPEDEDDAEAEDANAFTLFDGEEWDEDASEPTDTTDTTDITGEYGDK